MLPLGMSTGFSFSFLGLASVSNKIHIFLHNRYDLFKKMWMTTPSRVYNHNLAKPLMPYCLISLGKIQTLKGFAK